MHRNEPVLQGKRIHLQGHPFLQASPTSTRLGILHRLLLKLLSEVLQIRAAALHEPQVLSEETSSRHTGAFQVIQGQDP